MAKKIKIKSKSKKKKKSTFRFFKNFGLKKEKENLIEGISMLIGSGMNIIDILKVLEEESRTKRMKRIILKMRKDIENGIPMWKVVKKTELYSNHIISLIKSGESSGTLNNNLKKIADQQRKDSIFRSRIKSAMRYPMFIVILMVVLTIGIVWFILPKLIAIFEGFNSDLPFLTVMIIKIARLFEDYGYILGPSIIILLVLFLFFFFKCKKTNFLGHWLILKLPISRQIVQEIEFFRVGYIMNQLLNSGVPIIEALGSLENSTNLHQYKKFYRYLKLKISKGNTFGQVFKSYPKSDFLYPAHLQQMILSAEKSGKLADTFEEIYKNYELKSEISSKNLATMLEPILLIVIGIGILIIALAVITPIYSILGSLK